MQSYSQNVILGNTAAVLAALLGCAFVLFLLLAIDKAACYLNVC